MEILFWNELGVLTIHVTSCYMTLFEDDMEPSLKLVLLGTELHEAPISRRPWNPLEDAPEASPNHKESLEPVTCHQ